jgi:hypothetical protein
MCGASARRLKLSPGSLFSRFLFVFSVRGIYKKGRGASQFMDLEEVTRVNCISGV